MSTNGLTILLADDDHTQLSYLSTLVRRLRPSWKIVAESTTTAEITRDLARFSPAIAILDIRFADSTAFEIVQGLRESFPVIFITGDATYAAEAFTHDAIDFLLKPLRAERLEQALQKAEASVGAKPVRSNAPGHLKSLRMIRGHDLVWAPLTEVRFFEAQKKYTRVVLKDQDGLLRMGIGSVAQHLDVHQFWRIHRGIILNVAHMAAANRDDLGRMVVRIIDRKEKLIVSRPYEHLFKDGFS